MKSKLLALLSLLVVALFVVYMIADIVKPSDMVVQVNNEENIPDEQWELTDEIKIEEGTPCAVSVAADGNICIGGDSFITCLDSELKSRWSIKTEMPVTSLSVFDSIIFASTRNHIIRIDRNGRITGELGPWDEESIITSISASRSSIAVSDANSKSVYIIDNGGEVVDIFGNDDNEFIIPSPYFDVVNTGSGYYIANTGKRRIERFNERGEMTGYFGESGLSPDAFCGCCNPAHFTQIPGGFITAEKGINRIKVVDTTGKFIEFVSAKNNFKPSVPLDIASDNGKTVYAVNPADSKLYVFKRKNQKDESK